MNIVHRGLTEDEKKMISNRKVKTILINRLMYEIINDRKVIKLHISRGVKKEKLLQLGVVNDLEQDGAKYKVIKPIVKSDSFLKLIDQINESLK